MKEYSHLKIVSRQIQSILHSSMQPRPKCCILIHILNEILNNVLEHDIIFLFRYQVQDYLSSLRHPKSRQRNRQHCFSHRDHHSLKQWSLTGRRCRHRCRRSDPRYRHCSTGILGIPAGKEEGSSSQSSRSTGCAWHADVTSNGTTTVL
jgi:hypothetical protein